MRRLESVVSFGRQRFFRFLLALALLYLSFLLFCELPFVARQPAASGGGAGFVAGDAMARPLPLDSEEETQAKSAPFRPSKRPYRYLSSSSSDARRQRRSPIVSRLVFMNPNDTTRGAFSEFDKVARDAWEVGRRLFEELKSALPSAAAPEATRSEERCPHSIMLSRTEFRERGMLMVLPCGLTLGSYITLVARPRAAHAMIQRYQL